MRSVFERVASDDALDGIQLSDYEPYQLAAYMLERYPGDPTGALKIYKDNHEIGFILYSTTLSLLEGFKSVKRN